MRDGWTTGSRDFDWGFASEPDERGVVEKLRRGRVLGGTSWMTRFAVRGSPADFDEWAALGDPGLGIPTSVAAVPSARLESDAEFGDEPWHGTDGPIPITRYPEHRAERRGFGRGRRARRRPASPRSTTTTHRAIGAGRMPMSSSDGVRVTTADAYLPAGGTPPNLTIRPGTPVPEVLFDGNRAVGVQTLDRDRHRGGTGACSAPEHSAAR